MGKIASPPWNFDQAGARGTLSSREQRSLARAASAPAKKAKAPTKKAKAPPPAKKAKAPPPAKSVAPTPPVGKPRSALAELGQAPKATPIILGDVQDSRDHHCNPKATPKHENLTIAMKIDELGGPKGKTN